MIRNSVRISYCYVIFAIIVCLLLSSCSSRKKKPAIDSKNDVVAVKTLKSDSERGKLVAEAMTWLGTPYAYAKADKGIGTDCSGMVLRVYEKITGRKLPRNSAKQAEFCEKISASKLQQGDLVFFATGKDPNRVSHVGIMLDSDSFIHASSSKGVVISKVSSPYYTRTFIMYGRVPR